MFSVYMVSLAEWLGARLWFLFTLVQTQYDTHKKWSFNLENTSKSSIILMQEKQIGLWCNGNTQPFGGCILRSSRCRPTQLRNICNVFRLFSEQIQIKNINSQIGMQFSWQNAAFGVLWSQVQVLSSRQFTVECVGFLFG